VPFNFSSNVGGVFIAYHNMTFSNQEFAENSQIFKNSTIEGTSESFAINITYDNNYYTSITASLIYNGTSYAGTQIGSGSTLLFNRTIITPSVNSLQNLTFYWNFQLYNGTTSEFFNSRRNNQSVSNINVDDCTTFQTLIYNFTLRDEDAQTLINATLLNSSIEINLNISSIDSSFSLVNISRNYNKTTNAQICIDNTLANSTLRTDGVIKYSAVNYETEYYNIQNATISNTTIPQNINLYDLLTTNSQSFLITFKDGNFIPQKDVLIDITRLYVSEGVFKTIEIPKTDIDGRTIGHFVTEDGIYTIFAKSQGKILATFQNVRVVCENSVIGDCKLDLKAPASTTSPLTFADNKNLSYLFVYNDTTKLVTFTFSSTSGASRYVLLNITKYNAYNNESVCSNSLTSTSGTLLCTIPTAYYNSSVITRIYVDNGLLATYNFDVSISKSSQYNPSRFLLAFFLVISLPLLAISSPAMTIIFFIVGLVGAGFLVLIDWGGYIGVTSALIWFIIAGIVLLWKVTRGRDNG
jgi:hypothetical protein